MKCAKKETPRPKDVNAEMSVASEADETAREKPRKKRKLTHRTSSENVGDANKLHADGPAAQQKVSKMKLKSKARDGVAADIEGTEDVVSKQKGKVKNSKMGAEEPKDPITSQKKQKKSDASRMKDKEGFGTAGGGKFAKLADTHPPKFANGRATGRERSSDRKPPVSGKATRYFDAPENDAGAKEVGSGQERKLSSKKSTNKGEKVEKVEATMKKRKRNPTNDLVIFD